MKKELLQVIAPLALCVMSVQVSANTQLDEGGEWEPVSACGQTLGSETSVGKKYRLIKPLTCGEEGPVQEEGLRPVLLMLGEGTVLDLNGFTIDCASNTENSYHLGVVMSGTHGKLIGSMRNPERKAKIMNCALGVAIGVLPDENNKGGDDTPGYVTPDYNEVSGVNVEDSEGGFGVSSNYNYLHDNIAQRNSIGFGLGSGILGDSQLKGLFTTAKPKVLVGNVFSFNEAYDNSVGFVDGNSYGNSYSQKVEDLDFFDEKAGPRRYNLFEHNIAKFNFGKIAWGGSLTPSPGGAGFWVQGLGGKYVNNYASDNERSGFTYAYSHKMAGRHSPVILAAFIHNQAIDNNGHGIEAITLFKNNKGSQGGTWFKPTGGLFLHNLAQGNGIKRGYDLFDNNSHCAGSIFEMKKLNRWIQNTSVTARPLCTQGQPVVANVEE